MIFAILYFYQFLVIILNSISDIFKHKITFQLYLQRFFNLNLKKSDILLHACSCGESKLLSPIIDIIEHKNISYQLSVHTPSGYNIMRKNKNVFLKPFDNFLFMFHIFYRIRPKLLIISVEDVWPFYIFWALYYDVKIYFVNYEINNYHIKYLIHYLVATKIFLKNEAKTNYKKYEYLGNLKLLSSSLIKQHKDILKLVIASANQDEFDIHLNYMIKLLKIYPKLKIIYVPRQLNWLIELKSRLKNSNYSIIFDDDLSFNNIESSIIIIWKYGLLEKIFSQTHICVMGDTFNKVGGHNLIEPGINENYIITGPNIHTCQDLYDILDGVYSVKNEEELLTHTINIIKCKSYIINGKKNKINILNHQEIIRDNLKKYIHDLITVF